MREGDTLLGQRPGCLLVFLLLVGEGSVAVVEESRRLPPARRRLLLLCRPNLDTLVPMRIGLAIMSSLTFSLDPCRLS